MDRHEIDTKIKEILVDTLRINIERITQDASLRDDFGMDSFGAVEVIFAIEDAFDINVPQEKVPHINTFKDMVDAVIKLTSEK